VLDPAALTVRRTVALPFGSQPYGSVFRAGRQRRVRGARSRRADPEARSVSGAEIGSAFVGANPRHLSLNADGTHLYVSRFITPPLLGEDTADHHD
jgi:hypothetical protein